MRQLNFNVAIRRCRAIAKILFISQSETQNCKFQISVSPFIQKLPVQYSARKYDKYDKNMCYSCSHDFARASEAV